MLTLDCRPSTGRIAYAGCTPSRADSCMQPTVALLICRQVGLHKTHFRSEGCTCAQVDLCKAVKAFPKSMSGCVRELFARMEVRRTLFAIPSVAAP